MSPSSVCVQTTGFSLRGVEWGLKHVLEGVRTTFFLLLLKLTVVNTEETRFQALMARGVNESNTA